MSYPHQERHSLWSFGQGHLVIFDFGNAVIAHYK